MKLSRDKGQKIRQCIARSINCRIFARATQLKSRGRFVAWFSVALPLSLILIGAIPSPAVILFLGDSITAGYGLDISQAYPALIQQKIEAKNWPFKVVNAGQSGDTTAGGLNRIDWLLRSRIDVLVLELGGNDGLRGVPAETIRKNLQSIIDRVKTKYPKAKIIVAGMKLPPNMGHSYTQEFESVFASIAKKNDAPLIPFILEGVGGVRDLNLPDGIHPTVRGQQIVAANVWKVLEPILRSLLK
jgi:acyl-CoA thioesterase I